MTLQFINLIFVYLSEALIRKNFYGPFATQTL